MQVRRLEDDYKQTNSTKIFQRNIIIINLGFHLISTWQGEKHIHQNQKPHCIQRKNVKMQCNGFRVRNFNETNPQLLIL